MERPSTSKARGICKYYQTRRGCFAGNSCKFLHGDPSVEKGTNVRLTPYDQAKTCRYFKNGYCKHGDKCWFLHVSPEPVDKQAEIDPADEACSICFEKPSLYGFLAGCSHVFCISCLKEWRDPKAKSIDVVQSGVHKKCPMCRAPSKFITPSSLFYRQGDPKKEQTISAYKDSMARVPCRYFVQSKIRDKNKPFCPFGKDCFYQHLNDDGSQHVLADGVDVSMRKASEYRERREMDATDSLLSDLFAGINDGSIRNTFDVLGRFIHESQLAHTFTDVFEQFVVPSRPRLASDANTNEWPLEGLPYSAVRVSVDRPFMPTSDHINPPPRASSPPGSSSNANRSANIDGNESDASLPELQGVSDDSAGEWSDFDDDDDDEPRLEGTVNVRQFGPSQPFIGPPTSPLDPYGLRMRRYPRVVFDSDRGFRFSDTDTGFNALASSAASSDPSQSVQSFAQQLAASMHFAEEPSTTAQETPTTSQARLRAGLNGGEDDMPPLQSVSLSEDESDVVYEDALSEGEDEQLSSSERIDDVPTTASIASEDDSEYDERIPTFKGSITSSQEGDTATISEGVADEQHEVTPRPFTTDGRGRVIAASDEESGSPREEGRSFISRMIDVLF